MTFISLLLVGLNMQTLTIKNKKRGGRKDESEEEENACALVQYNAEKAMVVAVGSTTREVEGREMEEYDSCDNLSVTSLESEVNSARPSSRSVLLEPISDKFWKEKGVLAKRRHKAEEVESVSSDETATEARPKLASAKRGRGRPPTTGKYVGLGKAQAELKVLRQESEREEARQIAEKEVSARLDYLKTTRKVTPPAPIEDSGLASDLVKQVTDAADVILTVATKSGNLKGTFTRALKDSAASITAAVGALAATTASEETAKLQADNASLRAEVVELRKELAELRALLVQDPEELPTVSVQRPEERTSQSTLRGEGNFEEMARAIMVQVGGMINARFEGMEERLLPEKRIRPPLAADKRKEAAPEQPRAPVADQAPQSSKSTKNAKAKAKTVAAKEVPVAPQSQSRDLPPAPETMDEGWSTVTKNGKKVKAAPKPTGTTTTGEAAKPKPARPKKVKLRTPKTAAVVITLQPGAEEKGVTYANVMKEARSKVDLDSCGVSSIRFRKAATGARILEVVAGDASAEKADALAQKLREALGDELAKVSRPIKCAEFRLSGLDDSLTKEDIVVAIALRGDCSKEAIKVGEIRQTYQGTGVTLVSCPVAAAKKLGEAGRLLVGWVSARVEMLQPRPLRCYRCLQNGHVRAQCTAETDRSEECYRCGQNGHKSSACSATPKCSICAMANKPSAHKLGSKACAPPKPRRQRAPTAETTPATKPAATTSCPPTQKGAERVPMETS